MASPYVCRAATLQLSSPAAYSCSSAILYTCRNLYISVPKNSAKHIAKQCLQATQ